MGIDKAGKKYMAFQMHLLLGIIVAATLLGMNDRTQFNVFRKNIDNLPFVYDNRQLLQNGAARYHGDNPPRMNRQVHCVLLRVNLKVELLPSFQRAVGLNAVGMELCVRSNKGVCYTVSLQSP